MTIQIPESLAHDLERLAAERGMTAEELAFERLRLGGRPIEQQSRRFRGEFANAPGGLTLKFRIRSEK